MTLVPRYFFVTSGSGESDVSQLNAFDVALWKAGIGHLNIVPVSSIIPPDAEQVEYREIPPGSVTFTVMSKETGVRGETISAGIAWARGTPNGYVLEAHAKCDGDRAMSMLRDMCREVESYSNVRFVEEWRFRVETMSVSKRYGAVMVALVFLL